MNHYFRSMLRFVSSLQGNIILGLISCLLIIGIALGKAIAQNSGEEPISASAAAQIQALTEEKDSRTPAQQKISSAILYTIRANRQERLLNRVPELNTFVKVTPGNKVRVNIKTNVAVTTQLIQQIQAAGAQVLSAVPEYNTVQALVPLTKVEVLASFPEISSIKPYMKPLANVGKVTSEGDIAHSAALARTTYGVDGTGVKIGVLSDSYNNLKGAGADINSGDLPRGGVTFAGSGDIPSNSPDFPGTDEGRAMLQIIHDLAPGAKLYYATAYSTKAEFASNIRALQAAGCDIIVDDISYLDEPVFQDGIIAQAVNEVTAKGALFFSSAGNSGNKNDGTSGVWEGNFVSAGAAPLKISGEVHAFNTKPLRKFNRLTRSSGTITLQWSDPMGKSANDYDLFVLNPAGTAVLGSSTDNQNGSGDPYEVVDFQSSGSRVVIVKKSGATRFLHLNTNRGGLQFSTRGQTWGHSAAVNAISVAAVNAEKRTTPFVKTMSVQKYSSDGPRRIFYRANGTQMTPGNLVDGGGVVRQKPDIAAADGVVTSFNDIRLNPFFGTSAAAPHAAAIAALVKSYKPSLTSKQIRAILLNTALDIEASGVDQDSGYGIVMANRALQRAAKFP